MRAMDDHPEITCAGAIFRKSKSLRVKYPELSFNFAEKKNSRLFKYFRRVYISNHLKKVFGYGNTVANGFRLMSNQAEDLPAVLKVCKKMDVKTIVLIRRNILRQAISLTIAQNAGLWVKPESDSDENVKIELDIQRLGKNINYFQRCRSNLENRKHSENAMVIYFEDLSGPKSKETLESIYRFIGVLPGYSPNVEAMKRSKYRLDQRILNYEDTVTFIKKWGLESLLTEE